MNNKSKDQKGQMTVKEAGEKGGQKRKENIENDPNQSYQKLGHKGGEATSDEYKGTGFYETIGHEGGSAPHSKRGKKGKGKKDEKDDNSRGLLEFIEEKIDIL